MDRASDSGSEGWGFESLPVCQKYGEGECLPHIFLHPEGTRKGGPAKGWAKIESGEQFLARGRVHRSESAAIRL